MWKVRRRHEKLVDDARDDRRLDARRYRANVVRGRGDLIVGLRHHRRHPRHLGRAAVQRVDPLIAAPKTQRRVDIVGSMTPRDVIFDFWGSLAPLAWDRWQSAFGSIAQVLGVRQEQFERAWRADYDRRLVSDLRESIARVCASLGVTREEAIEEA